VPRWERAWRWTRRRPALAALIVVSLAAAIALIVVTVVYTTRLQAAVQQEQAQRRRAQENLGRANEAIDHLLTRMGAVTLQDVPELQGVREEVLADARDLYETMLKDQEDPDQETRYRHALTLCSLARLQYLLGRGGDAEENYGVGLSQLQKLADEAPENPQYRSAWAHHRVDLGQVFLWLGRSDKAQETYKEVISLCQELAESFPTLRRELAYAYSRLSALPDNSRMEEYSLKALELAEQLFREAPDDPTGQLDFAISQHNLGLLYWQTGRLSEAEAPMRQAVGIWERMLRARPGARDACYYLGESCMVLAAVREPQHPAEALALDQRALASREELVRKFPTAWAYQEGLARIRHNQAQLYVKLGRLAEAEAMTTGAVAYRERAAAQRPDGSPAHLNLADDLTILGMIQAKNHQIDQAGATLQRAVRLAERAAANGQEAHRAQIVLVEACSGLTEMLCSAGRAAEALPSCQRAVESLDTLYHKNRADGQIQAGLLNALRIRASTLAQLRRHTEAFADWDRVVELASEAERLHYKVSRAMARTVAGDHVRAVAEAWSLAVTSGIANDDLYALAGVYAQAIPVARKDLQLGKNEQESMACRYAAAADTLLRQLVRTGHFKSSDAQTRLRKDDPNLEPLRARPEFQKLLAELPPK
jgi:tetratricopeptide (TPR) repeat protein